MELLTWSERPNFVQDVPGQERDVHGIRRHRFGFGAARRSQSQLGGGVAGPPGPFSFFRMSSVRIAENHAVCVNLRKITSIEFTPVDFKFLDLQKYTARNALLDIAEKRPVKEKLTV